MRHLPPRIFCGANGKRNYCHKNGFSSVLSYEHVIYISRQRRPGK